MIFKIQDGSNVLMFFDAPDHQTALGEHPDLLQGHVIRDEFGYVLNEDSIKELECWASIDRMRNRRLQST